MQGRDLKLEHCKSCGAPIYWLRYDQPAGKLAPIEAQLSPTGNCAIDPETRTYRIVPAEERADRGDLRLNHFATCPQKGQWRRKAGGDG